MTERIFDVKKRNTRTRERRKIIVILYNDASKDEFEMIQYYKKRYDCFTVESVCIIGDDCKTNSKLKQYLKRKGINPQKGDYIIDLRQQ